MGIEERVKKITARVEAKGKERKRRVHLEVGCGEDKPLLDLTAWLPNHVVNDIMQQFGVYLEKPKPLRPVAFRPPPRVSCPFREKCADYSGKCSECAHNEAKNYFKPKEE